MQEDEYLEFVQPYEDAMSALKVRLDVLNSDCRRKFKNYPIHYIQQRIKKKESAEKKMIKKGMVPGIQSARDFITDIAGVRVICYFEEDVYSVVEMIKKQTDMVIIKEADYIKNPKRNGYRSYHVVVGIPVYHTDGKEYFPVEIQIRTMSMDFWASMEHRISYKANEKAKSDVRSDFLAYSELLDGIEKNMFNICRMNELREKETENVSVSTASK